MRKVLLAIGVAMLCIPPADASAQNNTVKIGVLNDQSSSFSAIGGKEVVTAVHMAISDFGGKALGKPIEFVVADHQNKPSVGLSIASEWLEKDGVDAIADLPNSEISIGVNQLIGRTRKVGLFVSPLTDRPTEEDCNGHVVAWAFDTHSTVNATIKALLGEGSKTFFVLSPDSAAGEIQEEAVEQAVAAGGGAVRGKVRSPLGTRDFSFYLDKAMSSGAEELILNISGADLIRAMKQVKEKALAAHGVKIAVTFLHQADVRSIGAEALQGVRFSTPWFWGKDEASRDWGRRMMAITGNAPGWIAAGTYSAVTNYLKAVEKAGTDGSKAVLKALDEEGVADFFVQNGDLLPNGRLVHDMFLVEVKKPSEVIEKDDFLKLVATVPAAEAFRPLSESDCKLK